jgi:transcription-repair coupling factor (superfamily II helicase)
VSTLSVPRPKGAVRSDGTLGTTAIGGETLRDIPLLNWCAYLLAQVMPAQAS